MLPKPEHLPEIGEQILKDMKGARKVPAELPQADRSTNKTDAAAAATTTTTTTTTTTVQPSTCRARAARVAFQRLHVELLHDTVQRRR